MDDNLSGLFLKLIEIILGFIPFHKYISNETVANILSLITEILLITLLYRFGRFILKRYKLSKSVYKNLLPQFDYLAIKNAKKYYIPTYYQNTSPSRQEEPRFTHQYVAANKLIPLFINKIFNEKKSMDRFYLILADSGMGKTTFMINLYFSYHSWFNRKQEHQIRLFKFSSPDTIKAITEIDRETKKNTILLLDALDEDPGIISQSINISDTDAFINRVHEIIQLTENFADVLITCRTQYFPGQEDDPFELKLQRPDEKGFYLLNKLYISPFTDKNVSRYLRKKFGIIPFLNQKKKKRATQIVNRSLNLLIRPMLLNYIDYLIVDKITYETTYQIYETLISKWLLREAEKRKNIKERERFIENLRSLSKYLAIKLYQKWISEKRLYLFKNEALLLAQEHSVELRPDEITGQSLLTCDGLGNWKFAHKSIMEFFLARELYSNPMFFGEFSFNGFDMAKKFYYEFKNPLIYIDNRSVAISDSSTTTKKGTTLMDIDFLCIYPKLINTRDNEILATPTLEFAQNIFSEKFSFSDAIRYCNKLNEKYGYNKVYDINYNFLDENGNYTEDISKVYGFRLPSQSEWNFIFESKVEADPRKKTIGRPEIKFMGKILVRSNFETVQRSSNGEWCYDNNNLIVMKFNEDIMHLHQTILNLQLFKLKHASELSNLDEEKSFNFRVVFHPKIKNVIK